MKVIIEDNVARHKGEEEKELPTNTAIRFEIGNTHLSCKICEDGLYIRKINDYGYEESRLITIGDASNTIIIK